MNKYFLPPFYYMVDLHYFKVIMLTHIQLVLSVRIIYYILIYSYSVIYSLFCPYRITLAEGTLCLITWVIYEGFQQCWFHYQTLMNIASMPLVTCLQLDFVPQIITLWAW